jgi:predicted cupin superfamily sugar epimerase/acyl-coenzyme A thioesterase PaaI-like protein
MSQDSARRWIDALQLQPHPEGGHYRETWREGSAGRGHGTAIYYLLQEGERSHWHRVDAVEIWHFHAGDPLRLSLWQDGEEAARDWVLGPDLQAGQQPQLIVPAGTWQAALPLGRFTLCSCTVSPAFAFDGFEMAPRGWQPPLAEPAHVGYGAFADDTGLPPPSRHLQAAGVELAWRWRAATATVHGPVRFLSHSEGLPGHVHGGLLSTLCDEAMGWACWMSGHVAPGARVSVDFLAPLRPGDAAQLSARLLSAHGRRLQLEASVATQDGRPVAVASGSYVSVRPKDLTPFAGWPGVERFAQRSR